MSFSIRSRLLLLVLSPLLPALLGLSWLFADTLAAERAAHERTLRETGRALALVIERELAQRAAIARVLAQSRWLDTAPDLARVDAQQFEQQARRGLEGLDGWVELHAPGRLLLDTRGSAEQSFHPAGPAATAAAELADVPQVRPLALDGGVQSAYAALVQPVERDGRVVLNLWVTLRPVELQRLVDAQRLPSDWYGTVLDSRGTVVARHPGALLVGRSATAEVRARIAAAREGLFEATSLDGKATTGYFSTLPQGWTYVTAMPRKDVGGLVSPTVLQIALASLALLGFAVAGSLWLAGRIAVPVHALKTSALRLQAGLPVTPQATGIAECDDVALALAEASETIAHGRADLERQVADAVAKTRQAEQRGAQSQRIEALGRLTGGVAHDFNNLLGIISNSAHLIERHPAASELKVPVAATLRAVEAGSQLTQHLLRFAGRRPMRPQRLELGRWLPEVQDLMRSVLGRRVEISVKVADDTEPVHVETAELELALINLALNARDAMPSGGELRIAARNADATEAQGLHGTDGRQPGLPGAADSPPRRYVLIAVGDDGVGIPPDVLPRVFEPFFTTKAVGKGTGLGLSQVHGFCTQAGGTAQVASTPGIGTTVSLLPAAGAEGDQAPQAAAPASAPAIAGLRVLLVEDNEELGQVTAALLQSHGASVQRAANAEEALRLVAAQPFLDVVLSDVVMPGEMDGLALARRIRSLCPALPVVLISGYNTAASGSEFVVLRKPCPERELVAALRAAIDAAAPHAAPLPVR